MEILVGISPFDEQMTVEHVHRAQERAAYYGNILADHDNSLLVQTSKFLNVDRIVHTKTNSTVQLLWGHLPHTRHPNEVEEVCHALL